MIKSTESGDVLIVGINSFLGKALYEMLKFKYSVKGIFHEQKVNIPSDIESIPVDQLGTLRSISFKYIYIVSAYVPQADDGNQTEKLYRANVWLPQTLCELFPVARIILCSTVSVYEGFFGTQIIDEQLGVWPRSAYAISKLWSEQIVEHHDNFGILRISSIYGLGMKQNTFIPKIIESALTQNNITLLGAGQRLQNYIHVEDVAKLAIQLANNNKNGVFLSVADRSYSNLEIAEIIQRHTGCILSFTGIDVSKSCVYDNKHTIRTLGRLNYENIESRLKELIEWKRKQY